MSNLRDRLSALSPTQKALMLEKLKHHHASRESPPSTHPPKPQERLTVESPKVTLTPALPSKGSSAAHRDSDTGPMVIKLQQGTPSAPPLFMIHPIGGGIDSYSSLSRYLNSDWSLYGVRAQGLEAGSRPIDNMPQMVDSYLHQIRQIQPQGPYYLGGWSMGGVVAYAIAQQLLAETESVGGLVLIDSPAPGGQYSRDIEIDVFLRGLGFSIEQAQEILDHAGDAEDWLSSPVIQSLMQQVLPSSMPLETVERLYQVFLAHRLTLMNYLSQKQSPNQRDFPTIYFEADAQRHWFSIPTWGQSKTISAWKACLQGELTCSRLPCDHFGLLKEPQVLTLASDLNQFLYEVKAAAFHNVSQGVSL